MRRGRGAAILTGDNGNAIGVTLGADFTAEHEWGIKGIKDSFGIPTDIGVYGLERRQITELPSVGLEWIDAAGKLGFVFHQSWDNTPKPWTEERLRHFELIGWSNEPLSSAWAEKSFGVVSPSSNTENCSALLKVFESFTAKDTAIFLGGGHAFDNAGLCVAIASALPAAVCDGWFQADKEHHEVMQEFAATGIEQRLKDAGCKYFALSPKRDKDGYLIFWLNPQEQNKNQRGWMKLPDLEDWIHGVGKIPTKQAVSR